MSTTTTPGQRAEELSRLIRRHDHLYYGLDAPEIPDHEYDALMTELRRLEAQEPALVRPDSPTQRVGGEVSGNFQEVQHPEPMLSLQNVYTEEEFLAWHRRTASAAGVDSFQMMVEPKIDGLAVRLAYSEGSLIMAATRGDGATGEVVTHSVKTVRNIPLSISYQSELQVRGEIYMPRSTFEKLNERREASGKDGFATPRNAAAGGIRQTDPKETAERGLRFWAYSIHGPALKGRWDSLERATHRGFPVNPSNLLVKTPEEAVEAFRRMAGIRGQLDYDIDGVVIKVNDLAVSARAGHTSHAPRWAVAWKFPAERKITQLLSVTISPGRFGKLTPVAELEPVTVGGVTVQNASLHNEADMRRKDIRVGDEVIIERAGDVIPQVTGPTDTDPHRSTPVFVMPAHCPACQGKTTTRPDEAGHWCENEDCSSRLPERLKHFVSKEAMDIDHLGDKLCQELIDSGLVADPSDLYFLTRNRLLDLNRMGERSADRLLQGVQASKQQPLNRVLYSLGIYRLGRKVSGLLASRCNSINEIMSLTLDQMTHMDGVGPKIASSAREGLHSPRVSHTLARMAEAGVRMEKPESEQKERVTAMEQNPAFAGKLFVVTGKLEHMTRDEAQDEIRLRGGSTASSVTKSTNVLVVGDKPGSKVRKAEELIANNVPITIMEEPEFNRLLAS